MSSADRGLRDRLDEEEEPLAVVDRSLRLDDEATALGAGEAAGVATSIAAAVGAGLLGAVAAADDEVDS